MNPEQRPGRDSGRRSRAALRAATAAISLALVALAFHDDRFVGGGEGFGYSQAGLLGLGLVLGALCFAKLAWNARALMLVVSVGLTLAVAEGVLRQLFGPRYFTSIELDDRVLYRLRPGARREYTRAAVNGGVRIRYALNSQGFRGEELAPAGARTRVVVYGDSFIMAEFSRTEDTFAQRLEVHLGEALGTGVEVVNAGVAGYGPDQELRRMQAELGTLLPDLVIVALYAGNDFGDIIRNKLYRLADDGSLLENAFAIDEAVKRRVAVSRSELILKKALRNALGRVLGGAQAEVGIGRQARIERVEASLVQLVAEYREYVVDRDDTVHELLRDPYNADVSLTPASDSARYRIALMDRIIAGMRETTAAQDLPLLVVLIPSPVDVTDGHESGEVDAARHPLYRRSTLTDVLERICAENQVPSLDLFGPFMEHGARELYLKGVDDHWNEAGQELAARLASDFAIEHELLRAPAEGAR